MHKVRDGHTIHLEAGDAAEFSPETLQKFAFALEPIEPEPEAKPKPSKASS